MTREEAFEKMLADTLENYEKTVSRLEQLKAESKTKTVTYRELMGSKLLYQNLLNTYRAYGLTDWKGGGI